MHVGGGRLISNKDLLCTADLFKHTTGMGVGACHPTVAVESQQDHAKCASWSRCCVYAMLEMYISGKEADLVKRVLL